MGLFKNFLAAILVAILFQGCAKTTQTENKETPSTQNAPREMDAGLDAADAALLENATPCQKYYLSDAAGVRVFGSTTIYHTLIKPIQAELEEQIKHMVIPSGSARGLAAVASGAADIAMVSVPIDEAYVQELNRSMGKSYQLSNFEIFPLGYVKAGVIVNAYNPLASKGCRLSADELKSILLGESDLWTDVGVDRRSDILVVTESPGGGVRSAITKHLLDGRPYARNTRILSDAVQINNLVKQNANAIGLISANLVDDTVVPICVEGLDIYQSLSLVSFGRPSPEDQRMIDILQEHARQNPHINQTLPAGAKGDPLVSGVPQKTVPVSK